MPSVRLAFLFIATPSNGLPLDSELRADLKKPINQPADRFPISFRTSLIYVVFLGLPGGTKLGKSGFLEEGNDD